ncbi:MAG TPA: CDGSH iron-sulfur domain-containing protein [Rhizomicrobium sp.]|nr:CDGSH iron-sulfur domain-containing protein [Rhizomicrobium sp.]
MATEEYKGEHVTVVSDGKRCIHSRYCVLNLNQVFLPNVDGPWIEPDAASREAVIAVVTKCPSGSLRFRGERDTPQEGAPTVNTVRVWENGPLAFHAALSVDGNTESFRATLCRCGKSFNKPYCDGMHLKSGFHATGEPEATEGAALQHKDGPLAVAPTLNGPLHVHGNLEICTASGHTVTRTTETWLCRCGHSKNKPFCDGSHEAAGFRADGVADG